MKGAQRPHQARTLEDIIVTNIQAEATSRSASTNPGRREYRTAQGRHRVQQAGATSSQQAGATSSSTSNNSHHVHTPEDIIANQIQAGATSSSASKIPAGAT